MQKGILNDKQRDTNRFIYSDDNKRYHTWNYHLRHKFNEKVFKVSLDGGFTCPNIDGTLGTGGCIYCSNSGSGDFAGDRTKSIEIQFDEVKNKLLNKWKKAEYIAYFQAYTNTYAPLSVLKEKYEAALKIDGVIGLSIATRADSLTDDVVDYLEELSHRTYLIVELGLQTIHDETAMRINRCHSYTEFLEGYYKLKNREIDVCIHIINGLPGETEEMMIKTAEEIAKLNPHSIKIHLLHLLRGTAATNQYLNKEFDVLSMEEYVKIVCNQLLYFSPEVIIQRVTGDGAKDDLIAPLWSLKKFVVMNEIDKYMYNNNICQGDKYTPMT